MDAALLMLAATSWVDRRQSVSSIYPRKRKTECLSSVLLACRLHGLQSRIQGRLRQDRQRDRRFWLVLEFVTDLLQEGKIEQ